MLVYGSPQTQTCMQACIILSRIGHRGSDEVILPKPPNCFRNRLGKPKATGNQHLRVGQNLQFPDKISKPLPKVLQIQIITRVKQRTATTKSVGLVGFPSGSGLRVICSPHWSFGPSLDIFPLLLVPLYLNCTFSIRGSTFLA